MAQKIIDLLTQHPTWVGDLFPVAFGKCNDNFTELYAAIAAAIAVGGRNMLINCGSPINQRGFAGGALAAGVYGYDRWKAGAGGCNVAINTTTGVFTHSSGPLQQIVEAPLLAWGQPLTISVENPSGSITVSVGGATGTITSGSGRRGVTLTPSGSGNMTVQLTATGVTYSRPQLERGSAATAFDARPVAQELALCRRYFERVDGTEIAGATFNAADIMFGCNFSVAKRAAPALATVAYPTWVGNGQTGSTNTIVLAGASINGFRGDVTGFTGSVVQGLSYNLRGGAFTADAEL
ncbi:hypothetical protein CR156_17010 [Stenotrophomonas lactitubi]|uniref:hypothetical protein n=1 Tax=Stenotrophomonas lactitubi TaxID=2045214 RepID=UPI000C26F9DA|nr:hypothetical protein [Stenotrophomonas lactitubi]PJO53749.1 hypothetical protein CR156_17010 [Stenotrophomonas lactitubi]